MWSFCGSGMQIIGNYTTLNDKRTGNYIAWFSLLFQPQRGDPKNTDEQSNFLSFSYSRGLPTRIIIRPDKATIPDARRWVRCHSYKLAHLSLKPPIRVTLIIVSSSHHNPDESQQPGNWPQQNKAKYSAVMVINKFFYLSMYLIAHANPTSLSSNTIITIWSWNQLSSTALPPYTNIFLDKIIATN